jgi:hypothetical protein
MDAACNNTTALHQAAASREPATTQQHYIKQQRAGSLQQQQHYMKQSSEPGACNNNNSITWSKAASQEHAATTTFHDAMQIAWSLQLVTALHEAMQRNVNWRKCYQMLADPGCISQIPDPDFSTPDPGTEFFPSGSATKKLKYFNPKKCF